MEPAAVPESGRKAPESPVAKAAEVMGRIACNKIIWTDDMIQTIRDLYPTTPSCDIADMLGVSDDTVRRKANELGVKHDESFRTQNFRGRYTRRHGKYNIYGKGPTTD